MQKICVFSIVSLLFLMIGCRATDPKKEKVSYKVVKVLESQDLDLNQKIGQVLMVSLSSSRPLLVSDKLYRELEKSIYKYHIGNYILFAKDLDTPRQIIELTTKLRRFSEQANNNISPLIGIDHEGGRIHRFQNEVTHFPSARKLGERLSLAEIKMISGFMSEELFALGFNLNFAPVLDVYLSEKSRVIGDRSYGKDPIWVLQCGRAFIQGHKEARIISVGKHFPGHGSTPVDSHKKLPCIKRTRTEIDKFELLPFRTLIKEHQIDVIMTGHLLFEKIDSVPATLSTVFLTDILRKEWGFKGVVVSDDLLMKALMQNYSFEDVVVKAFNAGVDLLLICKGDIYWKRAYDALHNAVQSGDISKARLNQAVERILNLKSKYNLSRREFPDPDMIAHFLCKPSALLLANKARRKSDNNKGKRKKKGNARRK